MAAKRHIQPASMHNNPAYTHGVLTHAGLLFISGQVAKDGDESVGLSDGLAQALQVFENIRLIVTEAGGSMDDIVKLSIFLTDPRYLPAYREARSRFFSDPPPASTGVIVSGLASPEWLVEVEAVADLGGAD